MRETIKLNYSLQFEIYKCINFILIEKLCLSIVLCSLKLLSLYVLIYFTRAHYVWDLCRNANPTRVAVNYVFGPTGYELHTLSTCYINNNIIGCFLAWKLFGATKKRIMIFLDSIYSLQWTVITTIMFTG